MAATVSSSYSGDMLPHMHLTGGQLLRIAPLSNATDKLYNIY